MTLVVDGITYDSGDVKNGITAGNNKYYEDPNGNALTEAEMDNILDYAKERNIDIIPVINSPGHMDAILVTMEELGIEDVRYTNGDKVSARTVNIENDHAISFVQELVKIYAQYFGNSGASEIFNFGADEYANDVFSSPGWGELQKIGLYDDFIDYANTLSEIIKAEGMLPMSFNDGIYYNSDDSHGTFDKDIIISYWTSGWWGFYVATPTYFADKGHDILNTNDGWYWVLGNIEEGPYNYDGSMKNIKTKPFNELPGGSTVESIGSMQAIWADTPSMDHGMDRIMNLMDTFSETHSDFLIRPADYSALDEALTLVPEDLTLYTNESLEVLTEAKDSIVRNLRTTDQDLVDAMTLSVTEAIDQLELLKADYSKVDQAIKEAETLNKEHYQDFSNVTTAINAVTRDLDITKQSEVDAMAKTITEAISQLELLKADYSKVDQAIKKAESLNSKDYSNFDAITNAINAVKRDLDITQQTDVDAMATSIETAINTLKKVEKIETPNKDEKPTLPQTGMAGNITGFSTLLSGVGLALLGLRKRKA